MIRLIRSYLTRFSVFLAQALAVGFIVISMLILITVLYNLYGNRPPIRIISLDPVNLGDLCPGDLYPIHNHIEIQSVAFIVYHTTVMDEDQVKNIADTQTATKDYIHPKIAQYEQNLPWIVPDIPPGKYTRVFAALGTNGNNKPEIVSSEFSIPDTCSMEEKSP